MTVIGRLWEDFRSGVHSVTLVFSEPHPKEDAHRLEPHGAGRIFGEGLMYATDNMGIGLRSV